MFVLDFIDLYIFSFILQILSKLLASISEEGKEDIFVKKLGGIYFLSIDYEVFLLRCPLEIKNCFPNESYHFLDPILPKN